MCVRDNLLHHTPAAAKEDALGVANRATISGHRRPVLADGEQRIGHRPIRIEAGSTVGCVPRTPKQLSGLLTGRDRVNCLPRPLEPLGGCFGSSCLFV